MDLGNSSWLSFNTQGELELAAVRMISNYANKSIAEKGQFSIVLAGGSTPENVYKLLAKQNFDWENWVIYYGDERCLSINDKARNSFMAESSWLSKVNIPTDQIFTIPAEIGNEKGSIEYEKFLDNNKVFDLVLLGLGEDGHIASIFPNQSYDDSRQAISVANAPKMPKNRISLTPSRLSNTENIMFLVVGQNKAEAIRKWKSKGNIPACYVSAKKELSILHFDVD